MSTNFFIKNTKMKGSKGRSLGDNSNINRLSLFKYNKRSVYYHG